MQFKSGSILVSTIRVIALCLYATAAEATTVTMPSVSIYPARTLARVKPSDTYRGHFDVSNRSDQDVLVKVVTEDWTDLATGGKRGQSAESWLRMSRSEFVVPHGKKRRIKYTIEMPADAVGEKMAQVFFEPSFIDVPAGSIRTRNGVIVMAVAQGTEKLDVGEPTVRLLRGSGQDLDTVHLSVKNAGNVHIQLAAAVQFKDESGRTAGEVTLRTDRSIVSGDTRVLSGTLDQLSSRARDRLTATVQFRFGIESPKGETREFTVPVKMEGVQQ